MLAVGVSILSTKRMKHKRMYGGSASGFGKEQEVCDAGPEVRRRVLAEDL